MDTLPFRTPSVGHIVKKTIAINPELNVQQIIQFIRQSIRVQPQSEEPGEFAQAEIVDEENVLRLAKESLRPRSIQN